MTPQDKAQIMRDREFGVLTSPFHTHPVTHTVIVTSPIRLRRWATSEALAEALATAYRANGYTVIVEKGAK